MSCRFERADRISFVAENPKRPGSDAFKRFAKYSSARSVEEALLLGAWRGDLKNDEEKGFLRRGQPQSNVGGASANVGKAGAGASAKKLKAKVQAGAGETAKKLKLKVQKHSRQAANTSTTSGLTMSYVKDVPLSPLQGEEALKLWQEMQDVGWRLCEFRFLAGIRRGSLYRRFVQPPAKKESSKRLAPLGKSINGGFPAAIKLYAKQNPKAKWMVQKVFNERAEMCKKREKGTLREFREEREKCVSTYRQKYGCLGSTALLFKRHPGWQEQAEAFISPDGQRFVKSMSANNLLHVLGDMEAYIGKQMLKESRPNDKPGSKLQFARVGRHVSKEHTMAKSNLTAKVVKKAKSKVKSNAKVKMAAVQSSRIAALTQMIVKTLLSSNGQRCLKNSRTTSKDLEALIERQL